MKLFTFVASKYRTNHKTKNETKEQNFHKSRNIFLFLGIIVLSLSFLALLPQKEKPLSRQIFFAQANMKTTAKKAGVAFISPKELGKTSVAVFRKTVEINASNSINKVVNIQPKNDQQLNATLDFQYNESDLNGLDESSLILYSSVDNGKTWQPHFNSIVDSKSNIIHLENIGHFSLWTAAPPPPDDNDGDGIADDVDLDDDNDGILDTDEGCGSTPELPENFMIPLYHANIINSANGLTFISGQDANPTGSDNIEVFSEVKPGGPIAGGGGGDSNWPNYNGSNVQLVGADSGDPQFVLLTTTDLYVWGNEGELIPSSLTTGSDFQAITSTLPVSVSDISSITSGSGILAIVTNSGEIYTLGSTDKTDDGWIYGDGSDDNQDDAWHHVETAPGVFLTDVVDLDITHEGAFAITSANDWYTWGPDASLGDGSASSSIGRATLMTKPAGFTSIPMQIEMTAGKSSSSSSPASYFALNATDKKIYSMGGNTSGQLAIGSTSDNFSWTTVQTDAGNDLENVVFIGCNSYNYYYPSCSAITEDPGTGLREFYLWGANSSDMLSSGLDSPQEYAGIPDYDNATYSDIDGDSNIDVNDRYPIRSAAGGHLTEYYDAYQGRFCFVGHNADGSFGATVANSDLVSVTPSTVQLVPDCQDTDNDGLCDCMDTDSDNDGCPDALEAAGNFTSADILNDTLTGGVDANGVPIAASGGQANSAANLDDSDATACTNPTIDAVDDDFTASAIDPTAGGTTPTVFANDDADGTSPATNDLLETPTIVDDGGLTGVTIDDDGIITVPANTTPGTYDVQYAICLTANTSVCDTATATIKVDAPANNYVDFTIRYNFDTQEYEVYGKPNFTQSGFYVGGGSQVSIVLPETVEDSPLNITTVNGGNWFDNSQVYAPSSAPDKDFHGVASNGSQMDWVAGEEQLMYTFTLPEGCVENIRIFENTTDPQSTDAGMGGGDFNNYFADVNFIDFYHANYDNAGTDCTPPNSPPNIVSDTISTNEDTPVLVDVLSNDIDTEGLDPASVVVLENPSHGTFTVDPTTGAITYTPTQNFVGQDTMQYKVCDQGIPVYCDSAFIYIDVLPVNDAPTIVQEPIVIPEDSVVTFCPTISDPDIGDVLTVSSCGGPDNGTATIDGNNCITYAPNPNYYGTDSICLMVCDAAGLCDTTPVYIPIEITPINDAPIAIDDNQTTPEDTPVLVSVLSNDLDPEGINPATVTIVTPASNGTPVVDPVTGEVTYTPNPDFVGQDTFTYSICDTGMPIYCDTAQVIIDVIGTNDPPTIVQIPVTTPEDTPVSFCPTIDDIDNGDNLTIAICGQPSNGTVTIDTNNCINYTPFPNYTGSDEMCVAVCDAAGLCDSVVVPITITPINDAPIANDDSASTNEDTPVIINVLGNDTDVEGLDSASVFVMTPPTNGSFTVDPITGAVTYTPNPNFFGQDSLTYVVCDTGMPVICDTAQVVINIQENNSLFAENDINQTLAGLPVSGNVILNDKDPQGNNLTVNTTPIMTVEHGELVLNTDGTYTYRPDDGFTGTDKFFYEVCDNGTPVVCDTAEVVITVMEVFKGYNNPPVGGADHFVMEDSTTITASILSNDFDPDGDSLTINTTPVNQPSHGSLTINNDGTFSYTPDDNFIGTDTMYYQICDDGTPALCDTIEITVQVKENDHKNDTYATDDTGFGELNKPITGDVLLNDFDPEGDDKMLRAVPVSAPLHGTVSLSQSGLYIYQPDLDFTGNDYFVYALCDDGTPQACDTAIVYLTIANREDNPYGLVAVNDEVSTDVNTSIEIQVLDNDTIPNQVITTIIGNPTNGMAEVNDNGNIEYIPNPDFCDTNPDTITYSICDENRCDTAYVFVTVNCEGVVIHDGFSPNGDGINDNFVINHVSNFPNNNLKVYNRWGNLVFKKAPYDNSWDGTWNQNSPIPDGTYFYIWKDGEGHTYSGYIEVHR